jgi:penicillin amidase
VLGARDDFVASDMNALQNDLDASYLEPTAEAIEHALAALPAAERAADDTLTRVAAILAGRERRADTTSVAQAYLVQARNALRQALVDPLVAPCAAVDSDYVYSWPLADEVVRRLLDARAPHLLDPRFADYDALVRHAARRAAAGLGARAPELAFDRVPWGRINRADLAHPLGGVSPLLAKVLDLPRVAFPGGAHVVRVMQPRHGASFRMVADLGDGAASTFVLPGGQSGHFRSPHYGDGFAAWWEGRPTPLEPGPPVDRARLTPGP